VSLSLYVKKFCYGYVKYMASECRKHMALWRVYRCAFVGISSLAFVYKRCRWVVVLLILSRCLTRTFQDVGMHVQWNCDFYVFPQGL